MKSKAFFDTFDEDKLLSQVVPRVKHAMDSWRNGMASDETALMNQLTSEFNKKRARKCDIGKAGVYTVSSELFELHRRGLKQVDEYGSDFALTINGPDFIKTAFFQFKISKNNEAKVEAKQIQDAKIITEVFDRSFVFAVDCESGMIRLTPITEIASDFGNQKTKAFDINDWESFSEWLLNWFRCKRGKRTEFDERRKIEDLLRRFSIVTRRPRPLDDWELPKEYLPSKAWLETSIIRSDG